MSQFEKKHFTQRIYTFEDPGLDSAKRIQVTVSVDGRAVINMQAREPGVLAVVSKPNEPGIDIVIAEASGPRYVDYKLPTGWKTGEIDSCLAELLGVLE